MSERQVQYTDGSWSREVEVSDDLLDEATRLADDYRNLDEGRVLRALVERVQQAEQEADTQAGIAAIRTAERDDLIERVEQAESDLRVARVGEALGEVAVRERDALIERVHRSKDGANELRWIRDQAVEAAQALEVERDEARAKLDKVRALATQWDEEAGDYVPPLPYDEPYNLMVNHSRDVLAILDGEA